MKHWLEANAWWLTPLLWLAWQWAKLNYRERTPPPPDAPRSQRIAWRVLEFFALTEWNQIGFKLKPIDAIGKPFPPPPSPGRPPSLPPES